MFLYPVCSYNRYVLITGISSETDTISRILPKCNNRNKPQRGFLNHQQTHFHNQAPSFESLFRQNNVPESAVALAKIPTVKIQIKLFIRKNNNNTKEGNS